MKRFSALSLLVLLIWGMLVPGVVFAREADGQEDVFEVEGSAAVKNEDLARARDAAIQEALQKAVERAVEQFLPPKILEERAKVLKGSIFPKSEEYVQDYRIMNERVNGGVYTVNVRTTVSVKGVQKDLLKHGLLSELKKGPATVPVNLSLRGIKSYTDYVMFREFLKTGIKGVAEVQQRSIAGGTAMLEVAVQGGAKLLVAELAKVKQFPIQARILGAGAVEVIFLRQ